MYCKCGSIKKARDAFNRISDAMIFGYAMHGDGNEALQLFESMLSEGVKPDAIVFIGMLMACSQAGLVEDGLKLFSRVRKEFGIKPGSEHFSCLVDLLGRSGHLELPLEAIREIPDEA